MRKSGLKFGLIGSASSLKKEGGKAKPIGSKPPPRRRPAGATAVFDVDSDEDREPQEDPRGVAAVNKRLSAISAKQERQAKKDFEDALQADPSVFDYDGVYDGMKNSQESKVAAATVSREKEKRQPKYIGNLLKQAKVRALESDRIFERKLQKEREEQDKVEGEATMKFVTSAYKKKLVEQRKWELQQRLEDEKEQRQDVTNKGMDGFYSSLITKNIAMGGGGEKSASLAASRTEPNRQGGAGNDEVHRGGSGEKAGAGHERATDDNKEGVDGGVGSTSKADSNLEGDDGPTAKMVDPRATAANVKEDRNPRDDEASAAQASSAFSENAEDGEEDGARKRARVEATAGGAPEYGETREVLEAGRGDDGGRKGTEVATGENITEEAEKAAVAKARKEAAIKAARERFLSRKKGS
ncbi:unnamed protein product [Ascophyllum nodosum]